MMERADKVRTVEAAGGDLQFDERDSRPGPEPSRLGTDMEWVDLAKVIVRTRVHEPGEDD